MPIIGTDEDEAGLDPAQGTHGAGTYVPPSGTPVASGGGESGFAGSGSSTGKTTSAAPTSSGSHYTNLTDYLSANQGSGQTMGQAASGVVQGVGQQATGDLGSYQTDAAKDAANATVNVDPSVTAKLQSEGGNAPAVSYGGPSDHTGVTGQTATDQSNAYGDLARLAGYGQQAAGGQAGNAALLKGLYQQPSYTAGENNLDAAVMGGTSGGQQGLSQIGQTAGPGKAQGAAADLAVDQSFRNAKQTTNDTASAYTNAANAPHVSTLLTAAAVPAAPTINFGSAPIRGVARKTFQPAPSGASGPLGSPGSQGTPINSGVGGAVLGEANHVGDVASKKATDYGSAVGNGVANVLGGGGSYFADGGEVDNFAMPDEGDKSQGTGGMGGLLQSAGKLAPLAMMLMKSGGPVPGKAAVPGDSPRNDTVPAMLSAREIVLPRSVTLSKDAPEKAAQFVEKVQKKKPSGYAALIELCKGGKT